jgi:6-phosphogluconolactonase
MENQNGVIPAKTFQTTDFIVNYKKMIKNPTFRIFTSIEALCSGFAGLLAEDSTKKAKQDFYSIALSGGSTPRNVFKHLAVTSDTKIDWNRIHFFWGDERCVPPGSDESNFRMANETLLKHIPVPARNIHRIEGDKDPVAEAQRYDELVRNMLPHKDGIPQFDLFMLGLGEDGHIASIFPDNTRLMNSVKLYAKSQHPESGQLRITATGKLIRNSRQVVFLVTGKQKAEIISRILGKKEGAEKLPASRIYPVKGKLTWMVDIPAIQLLDPGFDEKWKKPLVRK